MAITNKVFQMYLRHAENAIALFDGKMPFSKFIQLFFKKNPTLGSRDRKSISQICFQYFRVAKALDGNLTLQQKISQSYAFFNSITVGQSDAEISMQNLGIEALAFIKEAMFPWQNLLCDGMNPKVYFDNLLRQSQIFIRLRSHCKTESVYEKLKVNGVPFSILSDTCLALLPNAPIQRILDKELCYTVQDFNSQLACHIVAKYAQKHFQNTNIKIWDCCSGAGGKSLMMHDLFPELELYATDIRKSAIKNFVERMQLARVKVHSVHCLDMALGRVPPNFPQMDMVIADVPCSGSGTWARTPDSIAFFDPANLESLQKIQIQIAIHAEAMLKSGGLFCYITCSVFKLENEFVVAQICNLKNIKLIYSEVLESHSLGSDYFYIAIFEKV